MAPLTKVQADPGTPTGFANVDSTETITPARKVPITAGKAASTETSDHVAAKTVERARLASARLNEKMGSTSAPLARGVFATNFPMRPEVRAQHALVNALLVALDQRSGERGPLVTAVTPPLKEIRHIG